MHILSLDDANLLLQFNRNHEFSVLDDILCSVRKGLIHVIACSQSPAELSSGILSNSSNKIVFRLTSGKDIEAMQRNTGTNNLEQKEYFYNLNQEEHEVIIELTKRARPFVARIIKVNLPKPLSKEELNKNNERIMQTFCTPISRTRKITEQEEPETEKKQDKEIPKDEKSFLMDVYLKPYVSITQHYENLNLSAGKGNSIMRKLVRKQLCRIEQISLGGRGGLTKFLVMTEAGFAVLGVKGEKQTGRGAGFEHGFWQNKICEHLKKQGSKAEIEKNLNNKFIDVGVETEQGIIAIEIAITSEHEKENISKDIEAGCSFVVVACKNEKVEEEVKNIIKQLDMETQAKTKVLLLSKVLNMNPEELVIN
jgi:hypothetical protein